MSDITVQSGNVTIAARDHGGTGSAVLLVHGGGGHLLGWRDFPERLTGSHRVVSLDLRGHGASGDAEWTNEAVIGDLEAVSDHFGLKNPAVVGHSLGGMIAALWAREHPECPSVSIDGHRSAATHPRNYAGLPADQLEHDLAELGKLFDAEAAAYDGPAPAERLRALRQHARALNPDEPETAFEARMNRNLVVRDGQTFMRPNAELVGRLRYMDEFVDAVPIIKSLTGRFLLLLSTRDLPMVPPQFHPLMAAHRAGLRRDLAEAPANVTVADIDASHDAIREAPAEVADHVVRFLARAE